jgi:hypothetical protein
MCAAVSIFVITRFVHCIATFTLRWSATVLCTHISYCNSLPYSQIHHDRSSKGSSSYSSSSEAEQRAIRHCARSLYRHRPRYCWRLRVASHSHRPNRCSVPEVHQDAEGEREQIVKQAAHRECVLCCEFECTVYIIEMRDWQQQNSVGTRERGSPRNMKLYI